MRRNPKVQRYVRLFVKKLKQRSLSFFNKFYNKRVDEVVADKSSNFEFYKNNAQLLSEPTSVQNNHKKRVKN
jgi:hypothetical protein